MADFHVRDWLSENLDLEPDDLGLVGTAHATPRGQEGRYDLATGETVVVASRGPCPTNGNPGGAWSSRTLPDGGVIEDIDAGDRVVW